MWLPCPPMPTSAIARDECRRRISFSRVAISAIAGRPLPAGHVPVGPARDAHHDGVEIEPLLRETVLEAPGAVLVAIASEHAVPHELPEAIGEPVARDAEARLERLEAARAEERVAQDEERPAVAD